MSSRALPQLTGFGSALLHSSFVKKETKKKQFNQRDSCLCCGTRVDLKDLCKLCSCELILIASIYFIYASKNRPRHRPPIKPSASPVESVDSLGRLCPTRCGTQQPCAGGRGPR